MSELAPDRLVSPISAHPPAADALMGGSHCTAHLCLLTLSFSSPPCTSLHTLFTERSPAQARLQRAWAQQGSHPPTPMQTLRASASLTWQCCRSQPPCSLPALLGTICEPIGLDLVSLVLTTLMFSMGPETSRTTYMLTGTLHETGARLPLVPHPRSPAPATGAPPPPPLPEHPTHFQRWACL